VLVASSVGFTGIGLTAENYLAARQAGLDDHAMKQILHDHKIRVTEAEFLSNWTPAEAQTTRQREKEATVFHIARTFGADHVNVGLFDKLPVQIITEGFSALCRRAGEMKIGLEFMPFGGVPDLASAWDVVCQANQPNGGLLIDTWHWVRAATRPDDLAGIPPDKIMEVQLADVDSNPSPMDEMRQEALHRRLAPGRGYGDIGGLVNALRAHGVAAMISVEVMSDELAALGPIATAEATMAGAIEVLAACR